MKNTDALLETVAYVLLWCIVMSAALLLFWFGALSIFGDLSYRTHSSFIHLSRETFNTIHYAGILLTKTAMGLFFVIPYVAIRLVIKKRSA